MLFHTNAQYTPENLEKILKNLEDKGYSFVGVSKLIYLKDYEINLSGKQIKK